MVKHVTRDYTYQSPWQLVVQAFQSRFEKVPHPLIPSLIKVEFFDEKCSPETNEICWSCRGWVEPPVPNWLSSLSGISSVRFISEIVIDYEAMTMICIVRNEDLRDNVRVYEIISTVVHPENPHWTLYRQESTLEIDMRLFSSTAEDIVAAAYSSAYDDARKTDKEFVALLADSNWQNSFGFVERLILEKFPLPSDQLQSLRCPPEHIEAQMEAFGLNSGSFENNNELNSSEISKESSQSPKSFGAPRGRSRRKLSGVSSSNCSTLDSGSSFFSGSYSSRSRGRRNSSPGLIEQCFPMNRHSEEKEDPDDTIGSYRLSPKRSGQKINFLEPECE